MLFLEPAMLMKNLGGSELYDTFQMYYIVSSFTEKKGKNYLFNIFGRETKKHFNLI